ncbi:hypothetical protein HPP92_005834 [Vanilla planifolia]|uniref:Uncharacterized protein n=1 Tax=Vanilla planifolia TaxID=51239 RepID=A0A835RM50_VANPL|nr:hypothetical protein HPP92_005834 [Vanilla planifolia]
MRVTSFSPVGSPPRACRWMMPTGFHYLMGLWKKIREDPVGEHTEREEGEETEKKENKFSVENNRTPRQAA